MSSTGLQWSILRHVKKISLAAILLLLCGCNGRVPRTSTTSSTRESKTVLPVADGPQDFDYYLLNLSWSPEYCYSHRDASECGRHASFVLHGLWPQDSDGSYPQDCSTAPGPADPAQYSDIYPDARLLAHEWHTHGTCSGLSADGFFRTARAAFDAFTVPPQLAKLDSQISLAPNQILSLVMSSNPSIPASSLVLSCGNNYLTAVEVCLDKQLHPIACGSVRSCRARVVRIPPP